MKNLVEKQEAEEYSRLLKKYVELTKRIRGVQRGVNSSEDILVIDYERHDTHDRLNELALRSGKNKDDVIADIILQEGNLREYGIEAPVIKLPLIGVYFRIDETELVLKSRNEGRTLGRAYQGLYTPDDRFVAGIKRPYFMNLRRDKHIQDRETVEGDTTVILRWDNDEYLAIIYSNWSYSWGIRQHPTLHETRVERCKRLCRDFGLYVYKADDTMGHRDYSSVFLIGAEVPAIRLVEIALAMQREPEKYWLTEDELSQTRKF